MLKSLGEPTYGRWERGEPTLHLQVRAGQVQALRASAARADVSVSVFRDHPSMRLTAAPGQPLTYTIGVDNLKGDAAAGGVVLTAALPAGLSLAAADPPPTRTDGPGQPVWELGTLGALAFPSLVSLAAQVEPGVTPGSVLTLTAAATTSDSESILENNSDSFGVLVQPPGPDLVIGSSIGWPAMIVGQPVTFTLSVANLGNAPASGSGLTLTLPLSVTLRSAFPAPSATSPGSASWSLGELAAEASNQVTVTVDLDPGLAVTVPLDPRLEAGGLLTYTIQAGPPRQM